MPRKAKSVSSCLQCKGAIKLFYSMRFDTCDGWCSEKCFNTWCDIEERRVINNMSSDIRKKIPVIGHPTPSAQR